MFIWKSNQGPIAHEEFINFIWGKYPNDGWIIKKYLDKSWRAKGHFAVLAEETYLEFAKERKDELAEWFPGMNVDADCPDCGTLLDWFNHNPANPRARYICDAMFEWTGTGWKKTRAGIYCSGKNLLKKSILNCL